MTSPPRWRTPAALVAASLLAAVAAWWRAPLGVPAPDAAGRAARPAPAMSSPTPALGTGADNARAPRSSPAAPGTPATDAAALAFVPDTRPPVDVAASHVGPTVAAAVVHWHAARTAAARIGADGIAGTPEAMTAAAADAADAYARFAAAVPVLADQAALGAGGALSRAGDDASAAAAFATAAAGAGDGATAVLARIQLGNARLSQGRADLARAAYADALDHVEDDGSRAQAMAGLVAAELAAGDGKAAVALRLRLVRELPGSAPAAVALERLRDAGVAVTAQEEAAVYRAQGDTARADALLDGAVVGTSAGTSAVAADEAAWLDARAREAEGRYVEAAAAFASLATDHPASKRVAEALWRRAWLALVGEAGGDAEAVASLDALAARRPDDARAGEAGVLAGIVLWQAGRGGEAAARWREAAARAEAAGRLVDAARAHFWLGKAAGGVDEAQAHWQRTIELDPLGDGAARIVELGRRADDGGSHDASLAGGAAGRSLGSAETQWLSTWMTGVDAPGWQAAQQAAATRFDVVRGAAWLALGERPRALAAWRAAIRSAAPGDRLAIARIALGLGVPSIASSAAEQVLTAAPAGARAAAPVAVLELAYPLPWRDELAAAAAEHAVPADLLAALVRQESRWEPTARSGAGARGLTQVMPATGHGIAGSLGVAGFSEEQLDDPALALRFGAQYLGVQLRRFDGQEAVALAAYNAGPGNAAGWWAAAGGDVDVFMARIPFPETRRYVRGVIAAEGVIRRLGGR
ncbi:MAG: lytic transglycosylase domain-containing protein [Ardenticatenales bacterium]|nr:lytic transglycosylase domain-containing protein [Ardenticatenales bacterium]